MKIRSNTFPAMRCDHGCGECCGVVVATKVEADAVKAYAAQNGIEPKRQGVTCPWFQEGKCAVYPARPFVCQAFGHVEAMKCPRGYNTNITPAREKELMRTVAVEAHASGSVLLHDVVYDEAEMEAVVREALGHTTPLTIGGEVFNKPNPLAYAAGRTVKMNDRGLNDMMFFDQNTGEMT